MHVETIDSPVPPPKKQKKTKNSTRLHRYIIRWHLILPFFRFHHPFLLVIGGSTRNELAGVYQLAARGRLLVGQVYSGNRAGLSTDSEDA